MGRMGMGGRGMARPAMGSHFFSRNGTSHFASHQNFANHQSTHLSTNTRDHFIDHRDNFRDNHGLADRGVDRADRFRDNPDRNIDHRDNFRDSHGLADRGVDRADRFRDNHPFEREGFERGERFERGEHEFFFRHNFFVGFNFAAFGLGWWWGPWWDWWYPVGYYGYYPYYDCYAGADDPPANDSPYGSQYSQYGSQYSQYGSQYWNDLAMSVQSKLAEQSYYQGPVDGVVGSSTMEAIRRFQTDHGLSVTGKIDPTLLNALAIEYKQPTEWQTAG